MNAAQVPAIELARRTRGEPSMTGRRRALVTYFLALLFAFGGASSVAAQEAPQPGFDRTPPRLGLADGQVAFWRNGSPDWVAAQVNTALAAGDRLAAGEGGNLELQIGPRAFVRAGSQTQLGLDSLEPAFLQFRVIAGTASLDLRSLPPGQTVELDTPNAAFTVDHPGYYRVEVRDENTTFASRRGGRATVTPAGGQSAEVGPSEEVVVAGTESPQLETYSAPELDAWDRWNYERTDHQIDSVSERFVPPDVYGADDLDHNGDWRMVPDYGSVWVPNGVGPGWAPYTTGSWMYDPFYGWTWVDTAPWGWAPYHYGRWVHVGGYWGWAPGPIVARPYYAPALVAFFGAPGISIGIGIGLPTVGWVALGWGEPIVPWWGPPGCLGVAHWAGWGGPRVVNNVVINKTTVVNVNNITTYRNASISGAVVAVKGEHFGQGPVAAARIAQVPTQPLQPVHGALSVKPVAASLVGGAAHAPAPPSREAFSRPVVATRTPQIAAPALEAGRPTAVGEAKAAPSAAPVHFVAAPARGPASEPLARAPFGQNGTAQRVNEPPPPHFGDLQRGSSQGAGSTPRSSAARAETGGSAPRGSAAAPRASAPPPSYAKPASQSFAKPASQPAPMRRDLPGEPANRVYERPTPKSVAPQPQPSHGGGKPAGPAHGEAHPDGKAKRG
jgi:hypothetical protein